MATLLRNWSYRYEWMYDGISKIAALGVGGEERFRQLALEGLTIAPNAKILDLCCGGARATRFLVGESRDVVGLDASPRALERARQNVPQAQYVEGFAEQMPFEDNCFDLVHTSVALHEMNSTQLQQILWEVSRVLKPNGIFTFIDFHAPTNPLFWPGLAAFLWLFETETAWQLIDTDLVGLLSAIGFQKSDRTLYAGGSLQVIRARL
ncbi:class I SAM-dependent methyltransferase [Oscillatoriales cyanobacterium LEGE 11467]|uniref:Class I SAM-dependent methyltransferase n=1 Tax=Zarconia navalis LEGE 11467 TaxID=1828826 RepID=A0A928Z8C1_9CYAN|nr:class I SAM-dependent methyltransferase [Zarconia navalis]MBE9039686.1 class I SAM-dependent methyltransferase [Zarconia navalis LEGE 11467]